MEFRTPLSRARGLGSAKDGTRHWWMERLTAVALVPLTVWLVASFVSIGTADYAQTVHWIRSPVTSIALLLTIAALFHHTQLGLQVVVEDYIDVEWLKTVLIVVIKLGAIAAAATAGFCVLRIALGS